ncbi:hypothetical protein LZ016_13880 [Sphingomonas sp. SM33]|uniref:PAS domain-containing protein n=1 Tax=Sphingomonas telluris TaxID=2907998 RepID=A0ABS9VQF3_9SPHN|nr:hypothetical protein [Sphingomonas telluris]MCH8617182.1 hypothetical protein [Sphingomonas telluris]
MDSYREHPDDFEPVLASDTPASDVASEIGTDERRMHVRAYNYWVSLLDGRDYPSIEDLEPGEVQDFAAHSVLLDFTAGRDNPATPYIGSAIREECGLDESIKTISQVPPRSLLSRLTDHYLQIIANRAPIGFEAEFDNQRGQTICYRGILMPFSSDGDTIDFIYGVINWKQVEGAASTHDQLPQADVEAAPQFVDAEGEDELVLDEAHFAELPQAEAVEAAAEEATADEEVLELEETVAAPVHFSWEDGPLHDPDSDEPLPEITLDQDAGLADRLWAARETADAVKSADSRTRAALYRALSQAYDFALASEREPEDYAELLEESGVKAQARAPMTAVVKLVFGIDYDKSRLTEFAAALSFARRKDIEQGEFLKFIEGQAGGLKALVAAERQAKRPEPKPDARAEAAKAKLREAKPLSLETVSADAEFALVLARRRPDGGVEPVALVDDEAMVERAVRRAGI